MNKIYILTFCDLVKYGDGVKDVTIFKTFEDAQGEMKKAYLEKCKEEYVEEPLSKSDYDISIGDNYAYLSGRYYWDIFIREI